MKNRINQLFERKKENILSVYFTAGYPELNDTVPIIQQLEKSGVDLIEIGIPFSDPTADGPTIQKTSEIALQNGMVLVTYLNQLLLKGKSIDEVSIEGAKLRLRPVLMTALTTMLGLLPLLIATGTGSEVQRPLATVVTGGLFTSTILTLIVLPALYKWFSMDQKSRKN